MADLSKVLQALGAILQGGGGTLTAIDEDRRKKEREKLINDQLAAQTTAMGANQDRMALQDRMAGIQDVPEGGLPVRPDFQVPNPMGGASLPMTDPSQDPRIVAGGKFVDTSQASPNQEMEMQSDLRAGERLATQMLTELERFPQFVALPPEQQEGVRAVVATGHMDWRSLLQRLDGLSATQADGVIQQANFQSGQNIARRYGLDWDAEYIPGQDYVGMVRAMRGTEAGARINRAINPPSGGGGGALTHTRITDSAHGDANDLALQRKSITEITDALVPDYPNLTRGELKNIAQQEYGDVRKGGKDSLLENTNADRLGGGRGIGGILNRVGGITGGASGGGQSVTERLLGGGR